MDPTLAGFQCFIANVMKVPSTALSMSDPVIAFAFNLAMNIVNPQLRCASNNDPNQPNIYAVAVYNLAADFLVNNAQDSGASTFFADLRTTLNLNAPVTGVLTSTSDTGSAASYYVPESLQNLTIGQLQAMRTPWGRTYLSVAQSVGSLWGLS